MPDKVPRFITKWIEISDHSGGTHNTNKKIRFKTPMLRSHLCDTMMHILLLQEKVLLQLQIMMHTIKN